MLWCEVGYFCEVGYIPYLVYHYVLFLRSDVRSILAMHLRSRKDNAACVCWVYSDRQSRGAVDSH